MLALWLAALVLAHPGAAADPPVQQHVLTIEGNSTVTFIPQARLEPVRTDYRARAEYALRYRTGPAELTKADVPAKRKPARKGDARGRARGSDAPAAKVAAALDLSLHGVSSRFTQNGQAIVDSRISRDRFEGRLQPDVPSVNVSAQNAPARLQEILRTFDVAAATDLLDEDGRVIDRKLRADHPFRAVIETLLSIHTPIPRDVATWEAPTQLAMGHGQTARGTLRFEKQKDEGRAPGGPIRVKVSGVLRAEGVSVGRLIRNGTYTVSGEQDYDPEQRQWRSSRWTVVIDNELAGADGRTVAQARGNMTVATTVAGAKPGAVGTSP